MRESRGHLEPKDKVNKQTPIHTSQWISHSISAQLRVDLAERNSDKLSFKNTFCIRTLLTNGNKKEVWKIASSSQKRLKDDGQRRMLVSTFEDAVKSMEFCCSGCFSEHSTLSALTPKIAT
ncbi:PREDICTED: uncharacterized protein LOC106858805 [Sturnus vulgaris]|uniref:uncharacterized protein LOC106858805 n=1 Tax=Sturnus vulgaris TaxID=9172 RepID=UPI00071A3CF6|nr:PREDICTED: uncharacterized protein LOC106858805 [Sturnus vulgaris]